MQSIKQINIIKIISTHNLARINRRRKQRKLNGPTNEIGNIQPAQNLCRLQSSLQGPDEYHAVVCYPEKPRGGWGPRTYLGVGAWKKALKGTPSPGAGTMGMLNIVLQPLESQSQFVVSRALGPHSSRWVGKRDGWDLFLDVVLEKIST